MKCRGRVLLTLEPGISEAQTDEMKDHGVQLVVPAAIHETYLDSQRDWLMTVAEFLSVIRGRESRGG